MYLKIRKTPGFEPAARFYSSRSLPSWEMSCFYLERPGGEPLNQANRNGRTRTPATLDISQLL